MEGAILQLTAFSEGNPRLWEVLVGLFFQETNINPSTIDTQCWVKDVRRQDLLEKGQVTVETWSLPADSTLLRRLARQIDSGRQEEFLEAVRRWARGPNGDFEAIAQKAGWIHDDITVYPQEWQAMWSIKAMNEGEEKKRKLVQAKADSPRFFERCMKNGFCGMQVMKLKPPACCPFSLMVYITNRQVLKKRKFDETTQKYVSDKHDYIVEHHSGGRVEKKICKENCMVCDPDYHKRQRMSAPIGGRPTQFHAVPLEERAVDSQGRTLPWALEWHEDHPNARNQKRPPPEEKGPFGKSTRRKGSSRGTRTTTPAKKENPVLDGFERALKHDMQKAAEEQRISDTAKASAVDDGLLRRSQPEKQEPTQVYLHGYGENTQWAAIDFYEKVSLGLICEDYERQPPAERRKYPNFSSAAGYVHPRPLTKPEIMMSRKYAGGNYWIKVTFDSTAAADRAISHSPHLIQGHWVYAQLYQGIRPEVDEPILIHADDRNQGLLGAPKPTHPFSRPQTSSPQTTDTQPRVASTLPRNFVTNAMPPADVQGQANTASTSPSTASSATATGLDYPDLRNRAPSQPQDIRPATFPRATAQALQRGRYFQRFPDTPRNIIRPHTEAFLPQPSWSEKMLRSLAEKGWIPHDIIGHAIPRLENGDFDWANASFYWKILYWIDCRFGTDQCGLKDDD